MPWIRYRTPGGLVTDRVIEPGALHWDGALEAMYVPSWCRLREAVRVFAVHRILAAEAKREDHARLAPPRRAIERAFRVWYREQVEHVQVWFSPRVAGEIKERAWHASQRLEADAAGGVHLHLDISAPGELERWLLGYGADARVLAPPWLAEQILAVHSRAAEDAGLVRAMLRPASPRRGASPSAAARKGSGQP